MTTRIDTLQNLLLDKFGPVGPRAELEGLRDGEDNLVIVNDGQTRWVAEIAELIEALQGLPSTDELDHSVDYPEGSAEANSYARLCNTVNVVVGHPANNF